jgi:hypothetical protein
VKFLELQPECPVKRVSILILESVAVGQQPSIEAALSNWIVMAGGTSFEGHEANPRAGKVVLIRSGEIIARIYKT